VGQPLPLATHGPHCPKVHEGKGGVTSWIFSPPGGNDTLSMPDQDGTVAVYQPCLHRTDNLTSSMSSAQMLFVFDSHLFAFELDQYSVESFPRRHRQLQSELCGLCNRPAAEQHGHIVMTACRTDWGPALGGDGVVHYNTLPDVNYAFGVAESKRSGRPGCSYFGGGVVECIQVCSQQG
jgi:hypothetical protein